MKGERWLGVLSALALVLMVGAVFMALVQAPAAANVRTETERYTQRILYFHVPSAWVGFLAFFVTMVASVGYLVRRERAWDVVALSSVEVGVAFTTAVLVTGSIWAKTAWNTWWTWDPRLTTSAITWVIYLAYLMLRGAVEDPEQRARFASVYGIVGFTSVPITFMAIRWWRTIHPVLFDTSGAGLSPNMLSAFLFCLGAFTVLYGTLLWHRVRLEFLASEVRALRRDLNL